MAHPLLDRGRSQPRTLEGLQADYNSFQAGSGCLRNAKLHHNVIAPHFFDVPISQVRAKWNNNYICTELWQYHACTLALVFSTNCSTCTSCKVATHLDLLLATEKAKQGASYNSGSFGQCVAAVRHAQQLVLKAAQCELEASELDEVVTWLTVETLRFQFLVVRVTCNVWKVTCATANHKSRAL